MGGWETIGIPSESHTKTMGHRGKRWEKRSVDDKKASQQGNTMWVAWCWILMTSALKKIRSDNLRGRQIFEPILHLIIYIYIYTHTYTLSMPRPMGYCHALSAAAVQSRCQEVASCWRMEKTVENGKKGENRKIRRIRWPGAIRQFRTAVKTRCRQRWALAMHC